MPAVAKLKPGLHKSLAFAGAFADEAGASG